MATANDTFTGADSTTIISRAMDSGHTWALHPTGTASAIIVSNTFRSQNNSIHVASITPATADYSVTMYATTTPSGTISVGPLIRMHATDATWYRCFYHTGNTRWELRKFIAGVSTTIGTYTGDSPVGASRKITLTGLGTTISVLIDDVSRISVTDPDITATGSAGCLGGDDATVYGDTWSFADAGGATINLNPFGGKFQGPFGGKI